MSVRSTLLVIVALGWHAASAQAQPIHIVAFGDSLVAGGGRSNVTGRTCWVPASKAWPSVLESKLRSRGWNVEVANRGVPGDTAARAISRVEKDVPQGTRLTLVLIGANDLVAGASAEDVRERRRAIQDAVLARKSEVLMIVPMVRRGQNPRLVNWHSDLRERSGKFSVPKPEYDCGDREHYNERANALIAERAVPDVERVLRKLGLQPGP